MPKWKVSLLTIALVLMSCSWAIAGGSQSTSGVTAQAVIDRARVYLNETTASFWTDARLLTWLNDGLVDIAARTRCLEGTEKVTLLSGITEYAVSTTTSFGVAAVFYSGTTAGYRKGIEEIAINEFGRKPSGEELTGEPNFYCVWNDRIYVEPQPSSGVSGDLLYVYLAKRPSTIALSGANPLPAIFDKALTIYVVFNAFHELRRFDLAAFYENRYLAELDRYRIDYRYGGTQPQKKAGAQQ